MSKTTFEISEIAGGIAALILAPYLAPFVAPAIIADITAIGLSVALSGAFGLAMGLLNPDDLSVPGSQQNASDSASYRRIIYGVHETGGVVTYDSAPAGSGFAQNGGPNSNCRHQVYTVAGHEITAFGRGGVPCVVIDSILTELQIDPYGSGYYTPVDYQNPYGGSGDSPPVSHIFFEFDLGDPTATLALPLLSDSCPDWVSGQCIQRGRAKVHVMMRYDYYADGSQVGHTDLATSVPIYVNGEVPTFRFPLVGKPIADTRLPAGGSPAWQANTPYGFAQYVVSEYSEVQVQINGPGGDFESGTTLPPFATGGPGDLQADNQCEWLDTGTVQSGGWPGPSETIDFPYVFTDPNGHLQMLQFASTAPTLSAPFGTFTTGPTEPDWATVPGESTGDGGVTGTGPQVWSGQIWGGNESAGSLVSMIVNASSTNPDDQGPPPQLGKATIGAITGRTLLGGSDTFSWLSGQTVNVLSVESYSQAGPTLLGWLITFQDPTNHGAATAGVATGVINGFSTVQPWLCLGVPGGFGTAANVSNPALIIYDYLTNIEYGMAADPDSIDLDSINAAANLCEETVVVYIAANGGAVSENRYNCDGVFDESTARGDVLKGLVASCAGTLVPPGDLWHLFAGAYTSPSISLSDADLRGPIKGDFRISRRDICNGVKGSFIPAFLPTNTTEAQPTAWRWTDFPPYQGNGLQGTPNYIAEDGGQIVWKDIRLGFCTSIWQCQRLAKIVLQLLRFQVTLNLQCKLTAFQVQVGDTLIFTHARWAALAAPPPTLFLVTRATLVMEAEAGAPTLGVDLVLRQTDPTVYAFAAPTVYQNPDDDWVEGDGEYSAYGSLGTV